MERLWFRLRILYYAGTAPTGRSAKTGRFAAIVSPAMTAYNNCGSTECGASLDRALPEELMQIPLAVQRKRYLENSGPSVFGVTRMQKVASPTGETFIFLGAREGQVFLERTEKQKGEPFLELDSSEFRDYTPQK